MPPLDSPTLPSAPPTLEIQAPEAPTTPETPAVLPRSHSVPLARPAPRRGRLARLARPVAAVGLVVLLVWGVVQWWHPRSRGDDVLTATATVGDLVIQVGDKGELESTEPVQVMCEVEGGGKLVTILAEGTQVKKGEVVARFDTDTLLKSINEQEVKWEQAVTKMKGARSELEVQRNKAESEIAKADLALTLARLDRDAFEQGEYLAEVDKRKAALEMGKKELKEAEDSLVFTRGMVKKGFSQLEQIRVTEMTFEGKKFGVQQQETDLRVYQQFTKLRKETELKAKAKDAERELDRTKKSQEAATDKAESEVSAARKTADLEKKHLERLKGQLDKCVVKAPGDGIVIYFKRPWDESARIRPGATVFFQQPIFTLPDLNRMKVKLKVHESVVKKVKAGQSATLKADALSARVLHGKVLSVAALAQGDDWRGGGVKEYETSVSVDDLPVDAGLRPGMSAEVKILVKVVPNALTVPVQAVTEVGGKHVCYVVSGGKVERREVAVGDGNDQVVQVVDGLTEGDRVALDARSRAAAELGPPDPAKAKPADTPAPSQSPSPAGPGQ